MEHTLITTPAAQIGYIGRQLARLQQLKDTLTIVGMNFMLLFGIIFYGIAVPGLILYALRWRLVRGTATRQRAAWIWGLGAVHELLCALMFASASAGAELGDMADYLAAGYLLGLMLSVAGLAEALSGPADAGPETLAAQAE